MQFSLLLLATNLILQKGGLNQASGLRISLSEPLSRGLMTIS